MVKDSNEDRLNVIANLLALQVVQDKTLVDASWLLSRVGMKYADIAVLLGISEKSVGAHVSNKRKQMEKANKKSSKQKVKKDEHK